MLDKRYFIVKNKSSNGDGSVFATGSKNGDTYDMLKMDRDGIEPVGATVVEYENAAEARVGAMSVVFNDYSQVSDLEFTKLFEAFTTNDKNMGRLIRQAVNAWSAKNAGNWPQSYHTTVWPTYDQMEQRLSDGALLPAYYNFLAIPDSILDPVTNDIVDMSSLNLLVSDLFENVFAKYPR